MRKFIISTALAGLVAVSNPAMAESEKYIFDQAHTQILFFVDHLGFSMSQGEFHQVDGHFMLDRENLASSVIDVSIPTASIDMDDDKWGAHMKNEDFFNVEKYPTMTFKSTSVEVTGEDSANVIGDLTILDVTKPVTFAVKHNKSGKHPFSGAFVAGFSASGSIKRSEFGMNYGIGGIGDDVTLRLEVEGIRQ